MAQKDKMRWVAEQWRSRKQGKGADIKETAAHLNSVRGKDDDSDFVAPPAYKPKRGPTVDKTTTKITKKPKSPPKSSIKIPANFAPAKILKKKAAGLVAPGAKRAGRGVFKDTTRIANIAGKTGILQNVLKTLSPADIASGRILGSTHTNRGRKGANLVSIKSHH